MNRNDDEHLEGSAGGSRLPAARSDEHGPGAEARRSQPPPAPVIPLMDCPKDLPSTFEEANGEWRAILTKGDPFAVLFLDARNWRSISAGTVQRRYEILGEFWKKKIKAMRSGSRTQIVKKYGGPDQSEYLVESYPSLLSDAYEELCTEEEIQAVGAKLERRRTEAALAEVAERLELFLIDGELTPLEACSLFAESARLGLTDEMTAQFIAVTLSDRAAEPLTRPRGSSLKEQLCSVVWSSSRRARRDGWRIAAVVTAVFVIVLIALFLLGMFRRSEAPAPRSIPATSSGAVLVAGKTPPARPAVAERSGPLSAKAVPAVPSVPTPKPATSLPAEREAVAAEMQRRAEREAREAAQAAHDEIERSLPALRDVLAQNRFDDVETESERLLTLAAAHSLSDDITTIREIAAAARERKLTGKVEQERRARYAAAAEQIKQLADSGKYPEAISLANEILKDPQLPADLSERILESQSKARTELKRIMSSAVVKGGDVKPVRKH